MFCFLMKSTYSMLFAYRYVNLMEWLDMNYNFILFLPVYDGINILPGEDWSGPGGYSDKQRRHHKWADDPGL